MDKLVKSGKVASRDAMLLTLYEHVATGVFDATPMLELNKNSEEGISSIFSNIFDGGNNDLTVNVSISCLLGCSGCTPTLPPCSQLPEPLLSL